MGLFDDFDIDMTEIEENKGFANVPDGTYPFEITEARRQTGSKNNPDTLFFVTTYDLEENGQYQDWKGVAEEIDGEYVVNDNHKRNLGNLKTIFLKLGFDPSELNDLEPEDLQGIRGVLTLKTSTNQKSRKEYQNLSIVSVDEDDAAEPAEETAPPAPAVKAAVAAKAATRTTPKRTRAAAPAATLDDADENPYA